MDKLNKLKELLTLLQNDTLKPSDVKVFLTTVLKVVKDAKDNTDKVSQETQKTLKDVVSYLSKEHSNLIEKVNSDTETKITKYDKKINEVLSKAEKALEEISKIEVRDGKDADEQKIVEDVLSKIEIPLPIEETPKKIKDKLESLKGDKRLDISAIKGADKLTTQENVDRAISILDQRTQYLINKRVSTPTGTGAVDSVNGQTGVVVLDADDIDDTSTTNKFVTSSDITKLSNLSGTNTGDQDLSGLALKTNVLELNNTTPFTPDQDYEPATKKYVDDNSGGASAFTDLTDTPSSYTGQAGKFPKVNATEDGLEFATISGGGDMLASTYDPANGARQVAFSDQLHSAVTVTDSTEIDFTLTGQDITASIKSGSIDESKLDTSVNASLDKADSAIQTETDPVFTSSQAFNITSTDITNLGNLDSAAYEPISSFAPALGADDNYVTDAEKTAIGTISGKLDANTPITGATKTKITYDADGLVTAGADATTADIADSSNKRYVTDAQLTVIGNTSGTNTGDETQSTIKTKLGAATASVDGYATATQITKLDGIEAGAEVNNISDVNATDLTDGGATTLHKHSYNNLDNLPTLLTDSSTNTFTNKTFNANGTGNSITNLEVADFASGVIDTDLSSVSANDDTIPSAKATKAMGDTKLPLAGGATLTGENNLGENAGFGYDNALSADGKYSGFVIDGTAGATLAFGDIVMFQASDSRWELADANVITAAQADARGLIGVCVLAAAADGNATKVLLQGFVRADTAFPTLTINGQVYLSETAGDITQTQPTTADVAIRVLGVAFTADAMWFNPSPDFITHS